VNIEEPEKVYQGQFQQYKPDPSFDEEDGLFLFGLAAAGQKCRSTRQQDKYGRTKMGNPPGKIKDGRGFFRIEGIEDKGIPMEIITGMVKRHDDHDQTTKQVDRRDAVSRFQVHARKRAEKVNLFAESTILKDKRLP